MTENYEHYITRNIKAFYRRRLFSPIVYLILLGALWFLFPLKDILTPIRLGDTNSFEAAYDAGDKYVQSTFNDLHFTGYTDEAFGKTRGYYYYCMRNDRCNIVLLSPTTCEEGLPVIKKLDVRGKLIKGEEAYADFIEKLSSDLEWTYKGLSKQVTNYYFSEPDYHRNFTTVLFVFYFGSAAYALLCLTTYIVMIIFPILSPCCQNLVVYGRPVQMFRQAEEELATLPQLATEDMFITEHYFILTSPYGNAVVPIDQILWIYKYSTLHKILWYHFSISYTLNICTNKHMYLHCPKNTKSDIDGIMDYLSEANHDILVGFSEDNRIKVQATLGYPFHIERIIALFKRNKKRL